MITIYDEFGVPHLVTIQEFIAIEAEKLLELLKMAESDPVK